MPSSTPPSLVPSETEAPQQRPVGRATAILLGLAALPILIALVATNDEYGYFSDEFYYLACSDDFSFFAKSSRLTQASIIGPAPRAVLRESRKRVLVSLTRGNFGGRSWVGSF